jgi:hypothetical protein
VAFANQQADANTACPNAKNAVASEIKRVIDAYRTANTGADGKTTLEYIVIAGNRSVIPFYQSPDVAGMANEREYVPPVAPDTASEAGLKVGLVQGQDYYGSSVALNREGRLFYVPDLAVGRMVDNAADIVTTVDASIAANGVVSPASALVTGYDFVGDAATEINNQVSAGLNRADCSSTNSCITTDTLIQQPGLPPSDPSAWTASQLLAKLTAAGKDDIIVLTGHFAAGSLVAGITRRGCWRPRSQPLQPTIPTAWSLRSAVTAASAYPMAMYSGCEPDPDWAKAFLPRLPALMAASGYACGGTTTHRVGERAS